MKLSVIIPLFNVEEYAERAAKSIVVQAFEGLEVVLVDDGSTDRSLEVIEHRLKDASNEIVPAVVSIRQENMGPGSARNTGIMAASGEYIMFLDGDDFLLPGAFESILAAIAQSDKPDVLFGRYLKWTPGAGFLRGADYVVELPGDVKQRTEYICSSLPEKSWNVWRYVCRRDFIIDNEQFFDTGIMCGEDVKWMLALLDSAGKVACCNVPFYAYHYHREGSIMNSGSNKRLLDLNHVAVELLQKHRSRPAICRSLVQDTFYSISEYHLFCKAERKQVFKSYAELMPLYRYSSSSLHKIVGKLRNPALLYIMSVLLTIAKQGRRALTIAKNRGRKDTAIPHPHSLQIDDAAYEYGIKADAHDR